MRTIDDVDVGVAANASFGIFRAAARAYVTHADAEPMAEMISTRMRQLGTIFKTLETA